MGPALRLVGVRPVNSVLDGYGSILRKGGTDHVPGQTTRSQKGTVLAADATAMAAQWPVHPRLLYTARPLSAQFLRLAENPRRAGFRSGNLRAHGGAPRAFAHC